MIDNGPSWLRSMNDFSQRRAWGAANGLAQSSALRQQLFGADFASDPGGALFGQGVTDPATLLTLSSDLTAAQTMIGTARISAAAREQASRALDISV